MSKTDQVNICRCGTKLPSVPDDETPFEFCSERCKILEGHETAARISKMLQQNAEEWEKEQQDQDSGNTWGKSIKNLPPEFTDLQIRHWARYEEVRVKGEDMFDRDARISTGMDEDEYIFVMKNYPGLKEAAESNQPPTK